MYVKSADNSVAEISDKHVYTTNISNISYFIWHLKYFTIIFIFSSKFVSKKEGEFLVKATNYEDEKKIYLRLNTNLVFPFVLHLWRLCFHVI